MQKVPKLLLFCGLPGSGKTTIAKELEKTTGAVRLNVDEWWRRLEARNAIGAKDTVPITKELLKECWQKFQKPDEEELSLFDKATVHKST
jgi:predicted kinase